MFGNLYDMRGQCNNGTDCRTRVLVAIDPTWAANTTNTMIIQQAENMIALANTIIGESINQTTLDNGGSVGIEYGLTLAGVEIFSADPLTSGFSNCPFTSGALGTRLLCRMNNGDLPEFVGWMGEYRADVGIIIRSLNSGVLGQANQSGFDTSPYIVLP
ncbi:MAG: hypothetical protein AAFR59_14315, partial [Bacteroidota bacterium]